MQIDHIILDQLNNIIDHITDQLKDVMHGFIIYFPCNRPYFLIVRHRMQKHHLRALNVRDAGWTFASCLHLSLLFVLWWDESWSSPCWREVFWTWIPSFALDFSTVCLLLTMHRINGLFIYICMKMALKVTVEATLGWCAPPEWWSAHTSSSIWC